MINQKEVKVARLKEALKRLVTGRPVKVKAAGKLTLNKINNEAGLGGSYIHKFRDFKIYVEPIIEKFNSAQAKFFNGDISPEEYNAIRLQLLDGEVSAEELHQTEDATPLNEELRLTKEEVLRADLKREQQLKERYRQERDDARKMKAELEVLNNTLMYRLYELQDELNSKNVVSFKPQDKVK